MLCARTEHNVNSDCVALHGGDRGWGLGGSAAALVSYMLPWTSVFLSVNRVQQSPVPGLCEIIDQ